MIPGNQTPVSEFIPLGLSERSDWQLAVFGLILAMYLLTVTSNTLIITVTLIDPKLKAPMYFLLNRLSFVDMAFTSITVPQRLAHVLSTSKAIPFTNCLTQLFFILLVGPMEGYLLAAMTYDCYMAVCDPLWAHLAFCSLRILQFFCAITPMLQLSCSRPFLNEMLTFTEGMTIILRPFIFILPSYARTGATVLCLRSAAGLCKATSTVALMCWW
ncbi:olfactory receptor-like protein DTMT [Tachyglossus aculeatus]|uniref:olfactory receptor-like protein DTMT n=1 Tax=Tachyglossus aculeatus TaxID=9261 RepID=UPI0018F2B8BB|nr:olfactory receptor-like protein DTMT [Tachyglossus aculeatus]